MRTRTLLLLAVACGLAILVAGSLFLLRLSGQHEAPPPIEFGQIGRAGDATVVVDAAVDDGQSMSVDVRIAGVDDPGGLTGFTLLAPGKGVPLEPGSSGDCTGFTTVEQTCTLVFDTTALDGSSRVLLFRRSEDQLRWVLTGG